MLCDFPWYSADHKSVIKVALVDHDRRFKDAIDNGKVYGRYLRSVNWSPGTQVSSDGNDAELHMDFDLSEIFAEDESLAAQDEAQSLFVGAPTNVMGKEFGGPATGGAAATAKGGAPAPPPTPGGAPSSSSKGQ